MYIKIIKQLAIPKDSIYCPLCGKKTGDDFAKSVLGT